VKCLNDILTGKDNTTHDLGKWSWLISMLAVIAHDAYALHTKVDVNIRDFAIALAAVVAAHGFALGQKAKTEPGG
jgi:hypothetical protein